MKTSNTKIAYRWFSLLVFLCLVSKVNGQYCKPIDNYPSTGGYWGFEAVGAPTHNGADFYAPVGANVYAMGDGQVIRSGEHNGFGSLNPSTSGGVIIIKHKDPKGNYFYAVYGHLTRSIKDNYTGQPDEFVSQGQIIGTIRSFYNGNSFSPHLHLGIYVGSNFPSEGWGYSTDHTYWQDPKPWLDNNCGAMIDCNQNLTLSRPINSAQITKSNSLIFSWSTIANASYYEIWIDNNNGFGNPEIGFNNGESSHWVHNGIVSSNSFTLTTEIQNQLPQNLYFWKVRALDSSKNPLTKFSDVWSFSLLDQNNYTSILDELNGSTLGNASGITYVNTPNGQGAMFSRATESRIEYPFSKGLPHEGTIEMLIKVTKGYSYGNYLLNDNQQSAFIFNTGPSDVWYLGAMWLVANMNGDVSLSTALTATPTSHTLSAFNTSFRFNEWHIVSFSYGSQGQYLKIDGQLVASNPNYTERLQTCGNWENTRCAPTIGEIKSVFWANNQHDQGIEGVLDRFRASNVQKDWVLNANTTNSFELFEHDHPIKVYPNPVSDELIIENSGNIQMSDYEISNSLGQVITKGSFAHKVRLNTDYLIPGIYLIKIKIGELFEIKKIIKK